MSSSKKSKFKKFIIRFTLVIAFAIILGFCGSVGFQIYRTVKEHRDNHVFGAPVVDELSRDDTSLPKENQSLSAPSISYTPGSLSSADVSPVVECVMPAIVQIECVTTYTYHSFFGMEQSYNTTSGGTGFFVSQNSEKLYIATNNHVVADAETINVTLCDDTKVSAEIVGTDTDYDLAVISINISDLTNDTISAIRIASIGDSDMVQVGDMSIAIGNALGYGQSTTVGYISALGRTVDSENNANLFIQTDTAVNPGNSGGPLLNIYGQVIGINSIKYASQEIEGMCYAIPITDAVPIINDLIDYVTLEESEIGYLGIEGKDVSSSYSIGFGMPMGVYVYDIVEGSPADLSDLCIGDIITAVNGRSITSMTELKNRISHIRAGQTIELTVCTIDGGHYIERTISVTLAQRPKE